MDSFRTELTSLINKYSRENESDTPDFILADFVAKAIDAFDWGVKARDAWYGRQGLSQIVANMEVGNVSEARAE